jgi:polar amino acid transport system substrate-binding protein
MRNRTLLLAAALSSASALALSGCASSAPTSEPVSTADAVATVAPPAIRSAGTLTFCTTNLGSPPNVYTDEGGTLIGSEIDLAKAIAGRLALQPDFVTVDFAALIPSLQAGQCDVIMSSLYIKPEREEVVDFVPYLTSATGVAVKQDSDSGITGLDDSLCGRNVMVTVGTTAQSLAEAQSATCTDSGEEALDIATNNQATIGFQQLVSGQIDAYIETSELIGYYEKQGTAGIELVGEPTDSVEIGAATNKDDSELHDAVQLAFDDIVSSGDYLSILDTWGQASVALDAGSGE